MKSTKSLPKNFSDVVIGTYSGKSCDADVLNNNAMYLSRDLFTKLINSEEYATAIKLGWYIGYLGHPKDPNCMDFRNACIVMREMHMDDNGDVYATFDLLDTPVGKVVKTFIDAGVQFGISIRGAGDVSQDGTVDPDSFVFRGYDLVTFPAYDDAIPKYTDVAAATDSTSQQTYKKISSAINNNLSSITSCEAIEILQQHLNPVSEEYTALATREAELAELDSDVDKDEYIKILEEKIAGLTQLYLQQFDMNASLATHVDTATQDLLDARYAVTCAANQSNRKLESMKRILGDQVSAVSAALDVANKKNLALKKTNARLKTSITAAHSKLEALSDRYDSLVIANRQLTADNKAITAALNETKESLSKDNLIYRRKIEANSHARKADEAKISELDASLRKTVAENRRLSDQLSNRDKQTAELQKSIEASQQMILAYQQEFADMCADIVGIHVDNIDVTATTSPEDLRKLVFGASGRSNSASQAQPELIDLGEDDVLLDGMVTL